MRCGSAAASQLPRHAHGISPQAPPAATMARWPANRNVKLPSHASPAPSDRHPAALFRLEVAARAVIRRGGACRSVARRKLVATGRLTTRPVGELWFLALRLSVLRITVTTSHLDDAHMVRIGSSTITTAHIVTAAVTAERAGLGNMPTIMFWKEL